MMSAKFMLLLAFCVLAPNIAVAVCTSNQFTCKNGDCINGTLMCDGVKDCKDDSDEIFNTCYNNTCNDEIHYRCNYGGCVDIKKRCNAAYDCWDKSDENVFLCANDEDRETLRVDMQGSCDPPYALQCKGSQKCIMWSEVCDGHSDCPQSYDETAERCSSSVCPANSFRCATGACISIIKFCNHNTDCDDGSDEVPDICFKIATAKEKNVNVWKTNSCLVPKTNMLVSDFFTDFSYRPDAYVPGKTVVAVNCDSGYEIFGPSINSCDNSKWRNGWADCVRVCDQSAYVRNVSFSTQCFYKGAQVDCQQTTQIEQTKMFVTCAPGYADSSELKRVGTHSCNKLGTWSVEKENPICVPICGITSPQHPDIIPWTVSIFRRISNTELDYSFKCLGTILSSYVVIMADECSTDMISTNSQLYFSIVEGNHNVTYNLNEDHGYNLHNVLDFKLILIDTQPKSVLLTLVKPFRFGALVRPICLTTAQAEFSAEHGHVVSTGVFQKQALGEGLIKYENNIHTLTHLVDILELLQRL